MDLMRSHEIQVYRQLAGSEYLTEDGDVVSDSSTTEFTLEGNIQPFKDSKKQMILPDGIKVEETKVFRTYGQLRTASQLDEHIADKVKFENVNYLVFFEYPWTGFGLATDHSKYILIREDVT